MEQSDTQGDIAPTVAGTTFAGRPPSQTWEWIPFADCPQNGFWVWFKPASAPQSLILRIPDETWQNHPHADQLTVRTLLQAAGVEPGCVAMWQLYGAAYEGMSGTTPFLDAAIPAPATGVDPNIAVYVNVPLANMAQAGAMQYATEPEEELSLPELLDRIDVDWNAILETENELSALRKKLLDMLSRLKSLNRDLASEERLHASNQDKQDWLEARRWLRDASMRLRSCIKEYDVGDTSFGGQRKWFEATYQQFILPRRAFDGIQQAQRGYEYYRKLVLTLQTKMNTAYWNASQNGERRAQQILSRIAAKIREARAKKTFLGAILD